MTSSTCVIGGNGFLGGHVVDALLGAGVATTVFARGPDPYRAALPQVRTVLGDFTKPDEVSAAISGHECVVHCLTTTTVHTSNADKVFDIQSNLVATVRLLEDCVKSGVRRVVFVSSGGSVYGPTTVVPTSEDNPLFPVCSYGVVKSAIEQYLHVFHVLHGLEYAILRLSNPYGPRQNPDGGQGVIGIFAGKILRREPLRLFGDGSAVRDYVHAADFAQSVVLGVQTPRPATLVNIGAGIGASLNDIIAILAQVTGMQPDVIYEPARGADVPRSVLDIGRAERDLDWTPKIGLAEGIAGQVGWLRGLGIGQG